MGGADQEEGSPTAWLETAAFLSSTLTGEPRITVTAVEPKTIWCLAI